MRLRGLAGETHIEGWQVGPTLVEMLPGELGDIQSAQSTLSQRYGVWVVVPCFCASRNVRLNLCVNVSPPEARKWHIRCRRVQTTKHVNQSATSARLTDSPSPKRIPSAPVHKWGMRRFAQSTRRSQALRCVCVMLDRPPLFRHFSTGRTKWAPCPRGVATAGRAPRPSSPPWQAS